MLDHVVERGCGRGHYRSPVAVVLMVGAYMGSPWCVAT
jgi:hypothetical protein